MKHGDQFETMVTREAAKVYDLCKDREYLRTIQNTWKGTALRTLDSHVRAEAAYRVLATDEGRAVLRRMIESGEVCRAEQAIIRAACRPSLEAKCKTN